eukprot:TRINITY_DN8109_c0_g1_i2.p1 TRINITY_DN8109_c0_g1~~TRINITY_DN8109_c0_g1_i2.p1  ORF type:complete len:129 (-),score=24.60 TRINITY_DN8109_c0_g1_i2:243-629(-)
MFGDTKTLDFASDTKGLAPRAILDLLKIMAEDCVNYSVIVSVFDIYIDEIKDLAITYANEQKKSKDGVVTGVEAGIRHLGLKKTIKVVETTRGDTEIQGISKVHIKGETDVTSLMKSAVKLVQTLVRD